MTIHNALLLELRRAERKRRQPSRLARWWHRKLHGDWHPWECVRGWIGMSLVLWAGLVAIGWLVWDLMGLLA